MKKNMYLWVFIAVAVVLCGIFLVMSKNISNKGDADIQSLNGIAKSKIESAKGTGTQNSNQEKADLMQTDVDFEEDADDLADGLVDDGQFDESADFDSIENEVY